MRAAVVGRPIGHSLSPVLHRAAYAALGLTDWRYDAAECDEPELADFVDLLDPDWVGLSLTMPLKRAVLGLADEVSPLARDVGAANTLLLRDGIRRAENTDVGGMLAALAEAGVTDVGWAVVLGAGGTAQATLAALAQLGETAPTVLVRDPKRTSELRAAAQRLRVRPSIGELGDESMYECQLLISTLPPGATDALAVSWWRPSTVVFDICYQPWPTPLAASAAAAGCTVVSGLSMLLHQAAGQVELMTGQPAPLEAMRAALDQATGQAGGGQAAGGQAGGTAGAAAVGPHAGPTARPAAGPHTGPTAGPAIGPSSRSTAR